MPWRFGVDHRRFCSGGDRMMIVKMIAFAFVFVVVVVVWLVG